MRAVYEKYDRDDMVMEKISSTKVCLILSNLFNIIKGKNSK